MASPSGGAACGASGRDPAPTPPLAAEVRPPDVVDEEGVRVRRRASRRGARAARGVAGSPRGTMGRTSSRRSVRAGCRPSPRPGRFHPRSRAGSRGSRSGVAGERRPAGDVVRVKVSVEHRAEPEPLAIEEPGQASSPRCGSTTTASSPRATTYDRHPRPKRRTCQSRTGPPRATGRMAVPSPHATMPPARLAAGVPGPGGSRPRRRTPALGADDHQVASAGAEPVGHPLGRRLLALDELEVGDVQHVDGWDSLPSTAGTPRRCGRREPGAARGHPGAGRAPRP